jgi:hypothetical protein
MKKDSGCLHFLSQYKEDRVFLCEHRTMRGSISQSMTQYLPSPPLISSEETLQKSSWNTDDFTQPSLWMSQTLTRKKSDVEKGE